MIAEDIFVEAIEKKTAAERAAYLDGACGNDTKLRAEVEALIASDEKVGSFLEQPLFSESDDTIDHPPISEHPGSMIGPYKLLEQIGEGGFGVVFMAEQQEPIVRKVALKIIKPGMDTREVIARFEAERQALAIMDHPNIARVLDGGATESGRPYFVMELVKGIPITDYCDQRNLIPEERLTLFTAVCHAVQHAHQKGIIHRDIKPNNILVTLHDGEPVVKVIDFGVAKAISQRLTEKTLFTRFSQMVGTPLYMSPEQAALSGLDVDTRTDIYALGVLLYELLTGTTPFDQRRLHEAAYDEIRRIIREEEPEKPSTRISALGDALTAVCTHRQTEPRSLTRMVKGDLDWIVMKALEKDRERRYETANGLASDIGFYLKHEPVTACPPSLSYRMKKLWQRNSRVLATATVLLIALVAGLVSTTTLWLAYQRKHDIVSEQNQTLAEQHRVLSQQRDRIAGQSEKIAATQRELSTQLMASIRGAAPAQLAMAIDNVKPIRELAIDQLTAEFDDSNSPLAARVNIALALAKLGHPARVADFLLDEIAAVAPALSGEFLQAMKRAPRVSDRLAQRVARAEKGRDIESWARLAIVALYLGDSEFAGEMLRFRADNLLRTSFLVTFSRFHGPVADLASVTGRNEDIAFRTGITQAVGLVSGENDFDAEQQPWFPLLTKWCTSAKDAPTRSSAEWLLRKWGQEIPRATVAEESGDRGWTRGPGDLVMVHIPEGEFTMGMVDSDTSAQRVSITTPFMISDREVSIRLFRKFAKKKGFTDWQQYDTDESRAVHNVNRVAVLEFLNWLSEREGLGPCYIEKRGMSGLKDFSLRRNANGYRLPTEAEWEYACRAGTITEYSYGPERGKPLHAASSYQRLACLPNAWGLFDMHGEAGEIVEDLYGSRPLKWGIVEPVSDPFHIPFMLESGNAVVVRGSHFHDSSYRDKLGISAWSWPVTFRVVRNAPNAKASTPTCLPVVECDKDTLTRLATLNPESHVPHLFELARLSIEAGDVDGAAELVDGLLSRMAQHEDYESPRSQFITRLAHHAPVYEALVQRRPDDTFLQICRGRYYAFHEMWTQAADEFGRVIKKRDPRKSRWNEPICNQERHEYAILLLYAGKDEKYREFRKSLMVDAEDYRDDIGPVWTMLKASTLAPVKDADVKQRLRDWLDHLVETRQADKSPPPGLAAFRTGQYSRMFRLWENKDGARYRSVMAMADWRQGRKASARTRLAGWKLRAMPYLRYGWPGYFVFIDHILCHNLLLREAEKEIFGGEETRLSEVLTRIEKDKGLESHEYGQAKLELARVVERQSFKREEAIRLYEEILGNQTQYFGPDHPDTRATARRLADLAYDIAWLSVWHPRSEGEYKKAHPLALRAQQLMPDDAKYSTPVAWSHYRLGKLDDASKELDALANKVNAGPDTWTLRAILAHERGDTQEAINWYSVTLYRLRNRQIGTQDEAMRCLRIYDVLPPTNAECLEACDFLVERYDNDYHLFLLRGMAHVRLQQLNKAHADFKSAFDICPCFGVADWLANTSQLTGQSKDSGIANARLAKLIEDGDGLSVWAKRDLVQAFCRSPENRDYSTAVDLIQKAADENDNPSILLARSIARFRSGRQVSVIPVRNKDNPRDTVFSMCFEAIKRWNAGEHQVARESLAAARDYVDTVLASPDGPDFKYVGRTHAWATARVLLQEAERTVLATSEPSEPAD